MITPNAKDFRLAIVAEVRAGMGRHRITQAAMARKLGISRVTLTDRLTGKRAFDIDQLLAISDIIQIPLVDLLEAAALDGAA